MFEQNQLPKRQKKKTQEDDNIYLQKLLLLGPILRYGIVIFQGPVFQN